MFDFTSILTDVIALVGGGGLGYLISWRANRRKADAEAKSGELQNDETLINLLKAKDEVLAEKDERINKLTAKLTFALMAICRHGACPFREPERGRGFAWIEDHEDEGDEQLIDAVPIQLIARRYNYSLRYMKNTFKDWRTTAVDSTPDVAPTEETAADDDGKDNNSNNDNNEDNNF